MELDFGGLSTEEQYKLLVGSVQPRPIAWVSSLSATGERNIAPFSFFNVASRNPPTLSLSIGPPERPESRDSKDTLANIEATGGFVVNVATAPLLSQVVATSALLPPSDDEFIFAGLTEEKSAIVGAPRIRESPLCMECTLIKMIRLGTDTLVLGEVVWMRARDDLVDARLRVDTSSLQPVGRMAGPNYCLDLVPVTMTPPDM